MLPVNVKQQSAQFPQLSCGGSRTVDPTATACLKIHRPANQYGTVVGFQVLSGQPGCHAGCDIELRCYLCFALPGPDQPRVSPSSQRELQRVDQDGFAGPGFPCEHGESIIQVKFKLPDDHEIFQGDVSQAHVRISGE